MATAETEAPASSESRRQQLLPRAYGRARLPSTLQAQLPVARPRWHGVRRLRGDLAAGLTVVMSASATFRPRPAIVSAPGLSLVRNQDHSWFLFLSTRGSSSFEKCSTRPSGAVMSIACHAGRSIPRCILECIQDITHRSGQPSCSLRGPTPRNRVRRGRPRRWERRSWGGTITSRGRPQCVISPNSASTVIAVTTSTPRGLGPSMPSPGQG